MVVEVSKTSVENVKLLCKINFQQNVRIKKNHPKHHNRGKHQQQSCLTREENKFKFGCEQLEGEPLKMIMNNEIMARIG